MHHREDAAGRGAAAKSHREAGKERAPAASKERAPAAGKERARAAGRERAPRAASKKKSGKNRSRACYRSSPAGVFTITTVLFGTFMVMLPRLPTLYGFSLDMVTGFMVIRESCIV